MPSRIDADFQVLQLALMTRSTNVHVARAHTNSYCVYEQAPVAVLGHIDAHEKGTSGPRPRIKALSILAIVTGQALTELNQIPAFYSVSIAVASIRHRPSPAHDGRDGI